MEYYKEKPFIHLFQTPLGNYFYDVNTNEIVKIDLKTYEYLNGEVNNETYMVNNSSSRKRYASPKAGTELYLDLVFRQ